MRRAIGIFGGTFDPVHLGHIAIAQDFRNRLQLDEMRLLPCRTPPHRTAPLASDADRLAMLQLVAAPAGLVIDVRELTRSGPSYTYDSLNSLRSELGRDVALVLCMGSDAFAKLDSWYRWQELLQLAHLAIAARADDSQALSPALHHLLAQHRSDSAATLKSCPTGFIHVAQLSQIPVSSTQVRQELAASRASAHVHPGVLHYIQQRGLYQSR